MGRMTTPTKFKGNRGGSFSRNLPKAASFQTATIDHLGEPALEAYGSNQALIKGTDADDQKETIDVSFHDKSNISAMGMRVDTDANMVTDERHDTTDVRPPIPLPRNRVGVKTQV